MADFSSIYNYVLKRQFKVASSIDTDIGDSKALAIFTAMTASAPVSSVVTVPTTSEHNFLFFVNGQYIEHDAITIQQSSSFLRLEINTGSLGYSINSVDEITSWGKFE